MLNDEKSVSRADNDVRYVPELINCNDKMDFCSVAHQSRYQWVLDSFDLSDKIILDFGCGSGYGAFLLSKKTQLIHAVDLSSTAIKYAKFHYNSNNLDFFCCDATSKDGISCLSKNYDIITSFDVIEHLERYFEYLENVVQLIHENGIFIIGCPNRLQTFKWNCGWNPFHFQEFSAHQLKKILSFFFEEVKLIAQDFHDPNKKELARKSNRGENEKYFIQFFKTLLPKPIKDLSKRIISPSVIKIKPNFQIKDITFIVSPEERTIDNAFGLMAICSKPKKNYPIINH